MRHERISSVRRQTAYTFSPYHPRNTAPKTVLLCHSLFLFIAGDQLPSSTVDSPRYVRSFQLQVLNGKGLHPHSISKMQTDLLRSMKQANCICMILDLLPTDQMNSCLSIPGHCILDCTLRAGFKTPTQPKILLGNTITLHDTVAQFDIASRGVTHCNTQLCQQDENMFIPRI